jgi:ADP-heptose:LPS heptosyltransferase
LNPPALVLLSRTDNLGDVLLTLPMAGWIKKHLPETQVHFLGKAYTRSLIEACTHVDRFWDVEQTQAEQLKSIEVAILVFPELRAARLVSGIPLRIATASRLNSWLYANKRVFFSRKKSSLHEAQLNFKLFKPLKPFLPDRVQIDQIPALYGLKAPNYGFEFPQNKSRIVLHPKSLGSAKDWPLEHYLKLAKLLEPQSALYITGTAKEGAAIRAQCPQLFDHAQDLTGKLSLKELIGFLSQIDVLVACSTGPLHIAAALGVGALGLFSSVRPIHPARWQPLGKKTSVLVPHVCPHKSPKSCDCLKNIEPERVFQEILKLLQT